MNADKGVQQVSVKKILSVFLLMCSFGYAFADQTSVDRMLKENKEFIDFLDVCMSNFGEKERDQYFDVYEMHFNADVAYLQSDYKRAYNSIYNSQKRQTSVFPEVLAKYYLEDSKTLLDRIAPEIIKSKNAPARHYLSLGYRDRATARNFQVMADAQNPRQFSEKIFRYMEAIKISRRAMRFAFLSLFESRDIEMKKYIYGQLFEIEREKGNIFYSRFAGKTGEQFTKELNITFDEYEKRYQQESATLAPSPVPVASLPPTTAPVALSTPAPQTPVFERKVEREVRFRQEKRVAEYIRDAEFVKADDIITKYVEDFNFKMIKSLLEVLGAKQKDYLQLDYARLQIHHSDNFSRLTKPSMIEGFSTQLKVRDDIKRGALPSRDRTSTQASPSPTASSATDVSPRPAASSAPSQSQGVK
jgi:hypothetical protein